MKTVVLHSGGLDSTVLLYKARREGHAISLGVFYGQRHMQELGYARNLCASLDIERLEATVPAGLFEKGSLSGYDTLPEGHYAADNMASTVVPNRNMVMISLAVALAETRGFDTVAYGAHAGDHPQYPDCRPEFIQALRITIDYATEGRVGLWTPFTAMSKTDIVREGARLEVPFERTWSCYKGTGRHCGRCGTCVERAEAFHLAGIKDPTAYSDQSYWREAVSDKPSSS